MSAKRKMDVRNFFNPVTKNRLQPNLRLHNCFNEEKASSEAAKKKMRQDQIDELNESKRVASRKRRDDARNITLVVEDRRTEEEKIQDSIV